MTFNGTLTGSAPLAVEVLQGANELSGGLIGQFILLLTFGLVYYYNRGEPTREALTGAIWSTFFVSIPLAFLGILSGAYLGYVVVLAIGSLVMLVVRE